MPKMSVLTNWTKKLPEIPPALENHPRWLQHEADVQRFATAAQNIRQELGDLEREHARVAAAVTEDAVQEVLGGDAEATARVLAGKRRSTELEHEIATRRDRLAVQEEAERRVAARAAQIRAEIASETQDAVADAYLALMTQLAAKFADVRPVNDRLLALRATHAASPALERAVWFDELRPLVIGGYPNKMEVFLQVAREMGIDV